MCSMVLILTKIMKDIQRPKYKRIVACRGVIPLEAYKARALLRARQQ